MKKILFITTLLGLFALAACGGSDDELTSGENGEQKPPFTLEENLRDSVGSATRPTSWIPIDMALLDPTTSDRIVVTSAEIPVPLDMEEDLMAAFVNGECRDVASPVLEANEKVAFSLVVLPRIDEDLTSLPIELRYYSKHNNRIYIAESFPFDPASVNHGSLNGSGYKAAWH